MGYYLSLLFLSVFAVMENSILLDFRVLDGQPSMVLVAVIVWSWHADLPEGLFWAFVGGIALDVLNPIIPTGISALAIIIIVFAVKALERTFYGVSIFALIGFVALGTVLHHVILYIAFAIQGYGINPLEYFQAYMIPTLAFNLLGTLPMYWFLRRIQKRLPQAQSAWGVSR